MLQTGSVTRVPLWSFSFLCWQLPSAIRKLSPIFHHTKTAWLFPRFHALRAGFSPHLLIHTIQLSVDHTPKSCKIIKHHPKSSKIIQNHQTSSKIIKHHPKSPKIIQTSSNIDFMLNMGDQHCSAPPLDSTSEVLGASRTPVPLRRGSVGGDGSAGTL